MLCLPPRAPRPCRWSSASKIRSSGLIAGWMAWCAFSWAPCVPPSLCSKSHHRPSILFSNASYQYIVVLVLGIEVWVVFSPLYSVTHKALSKTIIYLYDNMSLYCSTMNNLLRMIFITVGAYFAYSILFLWYLFHSIHICDQIISRSLISHSSITVAARGLRWWGRWWMDSPNHS